MNHPDSSRALEAARKPKQSSPNRDLDCVATTRLAMTGPASGRVAAFLAAGLEQEPGAPLGLVDEGLEQARGAGILMVVGKLVGLAHRSRHVLPSIRAASRAAAHTLRCCP